MKTRTEIYSKAELEGGYFYVVEKNKIIRRLNVKGEGLTIEQFRKDNMAYIEYLKNKLECSNCIYSIGDSGEVGIADYTDELMWHPQIKDRFVRNLTEDDRKAISEAIEEAERKHLEAMEQYKMNFYSDKNELLNHLKKAMVELIDNTLGNDMEWRLDNFEEAKREVEGIEDIPGMIGFFNKTYEYVWSLEDNEELIEEFQEFGHEELDVRFCEKCGSMFCAGFYFPSFMYEKEGVCEYMCEDCF